MRLLSAVIVITALAAPVAAAAQIPISGCYQPGSGQIYRIRMQDPEETCRAPAHIMITWNVPGAVGPAGAPGLMGARGENGAPGPSGPAGERGFAGPTGPQGPTGPAGPEGMSGTKGPRGAEGHTGPGGDQGPQGVPGPAGLTGQAGADGAAGPPGKAGAPGAHAFADLVTVSKSSGSASEATATCPAGYRLTGYGTDGLNVRGVTVTATAATVIGTFSAVQAICVR